MSDPKYSSVPTIDPEHIGAIDVVRRVSEIKVNQNNNNASNAQAEATYIQAIRKASGAQLIELANRKHQESKSATSTEDVIIIPNRGGSQAKQIGGSDVIKADTKLSSSQIGVIEAIRRISGVNAAMTELEKTIPIEKPVQIGPDGKIVPPEEKRSFGLGDQEWHLLENDQILIELKTSLRGLSTADHEKLFEEFGPNAITPPKQIHWFVKFLIELTGGFQLMMW